MSVGCIINKSLKDNLIGFKEVSCVNGGSDPVR